MKGVSYYEKVDNSIVISCFEENEIKEIQGEGCDYIKIRCRQRGIHTIS